MLTKKKKVTPIKKTEKIVRWVLVIVLCLYIGAISLLNIPYIQRQISVIVAKELSSLLGSKLEIGRINIGLLNRIIIDDLLLEDRGGEDLLKISRLSVKFELLPLFKGKISIGNVQLFGFSANLKKETPEASPNFQFVVDAFASKDTVKKESNVDLRINSLLIRRGRISYNIRSEAETPGKFNPAHIQLQNIIANISLKALQHDSINAAIKRMSLEESQSGFELKRLSLKAVGNSQQMNIEHFAIDLPGTALALDTIRMEYTGPEAFERFTDDVRFSFHLLPSQIALQDISAFVPAFSSFKEPIGAEIVARGSINDLKCPLIALSADNHFRLMGNVSVQDLSRGHDAFVDGTLSRLYADREGVDFFVRNLSKNYHGVPQVLQNLGTIDFQGEISGYFTELVAYGRVRTDVGLVNTDVKIISDKDKGRFAYSGRVKTNTFELGKMIGNKQLGKVTLNLEVNGNHYDNQYPAILMKGLIASIDYSDYTYENIVLDGEYKQGGFNGQVSLDDENGSILLNGHINAVSQIPTFNFQAAIQHFRPNELHLTPQYKDTEISVKIRADFTGGSIDEMNGEINVDSLMFTAPDRNFFMDNLNIAAIWHDETHKQLTVTSSFLKGSIEGDYSYRTLPTSILNIMRRYLPSLILPGKKTMETENNFSFDLNLYDTQLLSAIFQVPLRVYTHSTLKGYFNDKAQRLRVEGYFPRLRYQDKYIESGMILCENPGDKFHASLRFTNRKPDGTVNVSVESWAKNDSVQATLNWGNSSAVTYSGKLAALTRFVRAEEERGNKRHERNLSKQVPALKTVIEIQPTQIILNDTLWQLHSSQVVLDSGKVHIHDFNFSHEERHLSINGTVSKLPQDTVRLDLKEINIGYVFDIADLGVNFQGEATGPAYASGVLDAPAMTTDLQIRNLGLNDGLLGNAQIHGEWHHDVKGIYLDAQVEEPTLSQSHVKGYIYPLKPTSALDLNIEARNTNLKFIHYYMESITPEFSGRASGHIHFFGKFKELTMEGKLAGEASMKIEALNTTFSLKDSIFITPDGLTFRNNRIYDPQGHEGRMSGELRYEHFKHLNYRFQFSVNNMLVMNTKESSDFPFYGTIYGTGNATISGNEQNGLNIDVAMTTNRNSSFTYIKDYVSSATSTQFIKFVDKTPRRTLQDSIQLSYYELAQKEVEEEERENETDIRLNLLVDATTDASMKIIMDPIAGDYISGRGTGNIRTEFYNKGDVKMFGSYRISQGVYKFSLQEVIRRDFTIRDGSSISFNGSPLDATLDIKASYQVNSASLNDLMPNADTYVDQTNVKVDCIMDLSGQLTSPDIKLELELPNERDEVQALVRNYIPTDEQMNMQILYLLSIGKFYAPENMDVTQNSNVMSSVLSSTLSGQLNNALSHIINSNNWNIGTNFSTGEKGWTDVEFEGVLSGQLLNNRLLINGNFGYRDNPLANTNFVGDFQAEWLVNRSGDIRLKAYNETNDRYYTRTNLTTQGIGIIFRKDFDKWTELLFWNNWRLRRLQQKQQEAQETEAEKQD